MKKISFIAVWAIVMMGIAFVSCDSKKPVKLSSDVDSVSYILGAFNGYQIRMQVKQNPDPPINLDALIFGFEKIANGDSIILGMELQDAEMYMNNFFEGYQMRAAANNKIEADNNKAEADKFLAENKGKSGVITTESGLQYKVITEGTGPKPKLEDEVKANYRGTYLDGSEFDSSEKYGGPVQFSLSGGVIRGWTEALQLMPVGSKYMLWVPVELGYGMSDPRVRPNSLLIFEVELVEIVKN